MTEFVALRPKNYSYLTGCCEEDKKAKGTKKCVIKRRLKFNDYEGCLLNNQILLKSQQRFKSEKHEVYTEEVNDAAVMIKDCKLLTELHHILMEQVQVKYVKQSYSAK